MTVVQRDGIRTGASTTAEPAAVLDLVTQLVEDGASTAPHVAAKLLRRLGDVAAVREVAGVLTEAERSGQRKLPPTLPATQSIERAGNALDLKGAERFALLIASLCLHDGFDVLLAALHTDTETLMAGRVGDLIELGHGQFRFSDPRVEIWLRSQASELEFIAAHERLCEVHVARGDTVREHWHRARSAAGPQSEIVRPLTAAARELNENGHPEWAFALAAEAVEHAEGPLRQEAQLVAGVAAVSAGCFEEASARLTEIFPHGKREHRTRALASLLITETCTRGVLPVIDPAEHRPRNGDAMQWHDWARTAAMAAFMCAERGQHAAMRQWLAELRAAEARTGDEGDLRDACVGLCWALTGEADAVDADASGPISGAVLGALCAAVDGDIERGLQLLARAQAGLVDDSDPLVSGFERSPLVGAYLAVTQGLLHVWRGDIAGARSSLSTASVAFPIALPFNGLGAVLARRLDIAVLGEISALPRALAESLPPGIRVDALLDSALRAYLGDEHERAATDIALWQERGGPEAALSVPGLEEVGPVCERIRVEPAEEREVRQLLLRLRTLPDAAWRQGHAEVARAVRDLSSPFGRARVEALLGALSATRGDFSGSRRHLLTACSLFEASGALAWRDATQDRLDRVKARVAARSAERTEPIMISDDVDPLASSRVAWEALLTAREIEVVMRVADGRENREIAVELDVSVRTVEVHIGRLFEKLGVRNRVELAVLAHRVGRVY